MSLPTRATNELVRAKNTRYHLIGMFTDVAMLGYAGLIMKYVKDIMVLYALEKALENALLYNFNETDIDKLIYRVREYINALNITVTVDYFDKYTIPGCPALPNRPGIIPGGGGSITPGGGGGGGTNDGSTTIIEVRDATYWESQELQVSYNGQTSITGLRIDMSNVDLDTVILEVQGDNPRYTTTGTGYHIVGTTLYWHDFYELKVGMQIKLRWRVE